jgi:HAD superfamily hydrolase (TIGR01490 family)
MDGAAQAGKPSAARRRVGAAAAYPDRVPGRAAAFFDLDKTIIAKSSTLAFSPEFAKAGLLNRRAMLRSALAQFVFVAGGADHDQMERIRAATTELVTGWDVDQVRAIVAETLEDLIRPMVYAEATELINWHLAEERDVYLVSSSGAEVVEPIAEMLGATGAIATRMEVVEGRYSGVIEYYAYGETKAESVRELAAEHGYDLEECFAYSDSITDVPMLAAVGRPFAVNPDKELRRIAVERDWPVLDFSTPVELRRRLPKEQRAAAAAAVGAAAVGAGLVWYAARRATRR